MNASANLMSRLTRHSFVRFAAVGALSTVIDIAVLTVLTRLGFPVLQATAVGFLTGLTNGFYLNSRFVFEGGASATRYGKYFLVSLGGLGLTELIVYVLHQRTAALGVLQAKLVAVVIVFFWNYGLSKVWAFKEA